MIAAKFGGTSLADGSRIRHVAKLIQSSDEVRYVVVSAPGKRHPDDIKITDLLYRFQETGALNDFEPIEKRFDEIICELGLSLDLSHEYEQIRKGYHDQDYTVSRGEYLSARIMAAYLGWSFIDSSNCIFFDENGQLDRQKTSEELHRMLKSVERAVLPGYYGTMPDGSTKTFTRGGSDVTGALVAAAIGADVYENWTDVNGILTADPRIVSNAETISAMTYAELEELAYQGATVLHEEAVRPVWDAGIPIHIRNTFQPEQKGTMIYAEAPESDKSVTGIVGRKGFSTIVIDKEKMKTKGGYTHRILNVTEKNGLPVEHVSKGMGYVSLAVNTEKLIRCKENLIHDLNTEIHADAVRVNDGLAMVAVVGSGMVDQPGIYGKVFSALGDAGINVSFIDMGEEMNLVIGVNEERFEESIQALYERFF